MSDVFPFNLPDAELRRYAKLLKEEGRTFTKEMKKLPSYEYAKQAARAALIGEQLVEVWRSRSYLCQIYAPEPERNCLERLSICRAEIDTTNRRWRDGLTWDELMQVKREVGYGNFDAVEAYPRDFDIVNIANFRHLFIFRDKPVWMWRTRLLPKVNY